MNTLLPIAAGHHLREQARLLARRHRGGLSAVVLLHAAAAAAGLAGPPILGRLVESVREETTASHVVASVRHDSTRLPSSGNVHAPPVHWSHPFFVVHRGFPGP